MNWRRGHEPYNPQYNMVKQGIRHYIKTSFYILKKKWTLNSIDLHAHLKKNTLHI
jgi:hypothetical protein